MYARRLVDDTRPVKYPAPNWVPNEYPPDYCGGCGELHQLNVHNACDTCMTWYCGCENCRGTDEPPIETTSTKEAR